MSLTAIALVFLTAACGGLVAANVALRHRMDRLRAEFQSKMAAAASEVTGLEQGREDLELLSAMDPLTGVWNYRHLQTALAQELSSAVRTGHSGALLLIDVDEFRRVNAACGHQRGSAVLRELAQRLALEIRQHDTLARYGGEEFVLILPGTDAAGAEKVAERLSYAVRKLAFEDSAGISDVGPFQLTISIGGVVFPEGGTHGATLLRKADEYLTSAKRDGHGSWKIN